MIADPFQSLGEPVEYIDSIEMQETSCPQFPNYSSTFDDGNCPPVLAPDVISKVLAITTDTPLRMLSVFARRGITTFGPRHHAIGAGQHSQLLRGNRSVSVK